MGAFKSAKVKIPAFIAAIVLVTATLAGFLPAGQTYDDDTLGNPVWDGSVAAGFGGGNGSDTSPFVISTAQELARLAERVNASDAAYYNKYYILANDIFLNDVSLFDTWSVTPPQNTWTPIGTSTHPFKGNFDGSGFAVFGIYVSATADYKGFFGHIETATVQNVGVEKSYIRGGDRVGGIAGYAHNDSWIINTYNAGSVNGSARVGGIVGQLYDNSFVTNSYNLGPVTGVVSSIGGVAGMVNAKAEAGNKCGVYNSFNTGPVVSADRAGGVVGQLSGSELINSYNKGSVTGDRVGGLVGNTLIGSTVSNSYNIGIVTGISGGSVIGTNTNSDHIDHTYYLNTLIAPIGIVSGTGEGVASSFTSTGELTDQTDFATLLEALNDWVSANPSPDGITYSTWFQDVFPVFTDISFSVTVTVAGGIGGTAHVSSPSVSPYYAGGTSITVTIEAAERYSLWRVTDNGTEVDAVNNNDGTFSYSFTLNKDRTVIVTFVHDDDLSVTVVVVGGVGGTAHVSSPGAPPYAKETGITVTITPAFGFVIGTVIDNGSDVTASVIDNTDGTFSYLFSLQDFDHTIAVSFNLATYSVNVTGGAGGTVSVSDPPYTHGTVVTVTIVPNHGYTIGTVINNASNVTASVVNNLNGTLSYSFTVQEDRTISVTFAALPELWVSVAVADATGGTAYVSPSGGYVEDDNVTVTIEPGSGFRVASITNNGVGVDTSVLTDNGDGTFSYTFEIKGNTIILVAFDKDSASHCCWWILLVLLIIAAVLIVCHRYIEDRQENKK
ncbi:MAG: hypothetical protein FWD92_03770 [Methanomassiliicoccaceae archaeon]|nr:hypothetical protein [Methanomassiliicoccaceae archaeon]